MLVFVVMVGHHATAQSTYYAIADGNWNTPSTWSTVSCAGAAAATVPGASDNVIICTGKTVTYNTADITIANLTVELTGVLAMTGAGDITLNSLVLDGTVNGNGGGDLRMANVGGSTLSGIGFFSKTNANSMIRLQNSITIPAGTDLKFNSNGKFNLNRKVVTNNGKISILNPSDFSGRGTFINNSSTSYLLYTRQANFPNTVLTATTVGNTVEFGSDGATRNMDRQGSYYHLIISGTATKRPRVATTTIAGNLTISNGSTLDANTRNINIAGNWINNLGGSFIESTGTVTFNGSTNNQTLAPPAGAAGETFYDLTINNTFAGGSVTANGNVTITNARTLRMTSGIFDMGVNTLTQASGNANLTATGGDLRLAKLATTLPEFTGTYNITGGTITFNGSAAQTIRSLNAIPANYHNIVLSGAGTKTLAGNITVRGNWSNSGSILAGNFVVTFVGSGIQTITNTAGENFYSVTTNTTGPLTIEASSSVTISNTLTMTAGNIDLNGRTLTLGNGSGATLVRTTGTAFGGTFRRYIPAGSVSSTVAPLYGLFPVGTSINYRPVELNSTANPTTPGYVSVIHTDAGTATDVAYTDNEGDAIQRVSDMRSTISTASLAGGTYTLSVSMTSLSAAGILTDLKMETLAGPPFGVGSTVATTGTLSAPTVIRSGLSVVQLNNTFVVGTKNKSTTPLVATYYSRRTGNWNDATVGDATWSLTDGGPSCNCTPISSSVVYINPGHTVTVTAPATADFTTVKNGSTLNGTSNFTANYDITTEGTGKIAPTAGSWTVTRDLNIAGTSSSTSGASLTITGDLNIAAGNTLTMSTTLSVASDLTIHGTLAMGSNDLTLLGTNTTIDGSLGAAIITGSGTITMSNAKSFLSTANLTIQPIINLLANTTVTNNGIITHTNNLSGVNAVTSIWVNGANSTLNTTGALLTTGTLNASAFLNTINYNGGGAQTIKVPSATYYNLLISNAGTKTSAGNISVSNSLTIQDAAILDAGTTQLDGTGDLVMTGTSEFLIGRATNGTYPELTGTYSLAGGTITFNPASTNYDLREVNYYNVTLSGSGNSNFDFNAGAGISNNLLVTLSGTSRIRNIDDALTIGNDFIFNSTSSNASILSDDVTTGTFTLTAGLVNAGGFTFEITKAGGWTKNGGTFTPAATGTGSVVFSGSLDQSINGSSVTTFTDLEINNNGTIGVQLNQDITVNGTLTFNIGNLITSATNILTMSAGSTVATVSNDSFVEGPMEKVGNTDFTFPVGKDGSYRPISVSSLSASGTFTAEYFHSDPNGASYNTSIKDVSLTRVNSGEYWILNRTSGTQNAFVTLSWDSYSGTVDDLAGLAVARWDGSAWKDHGNGGTTGSVSPGTGTIITLAIVTSFSPITLASTNANNALPVELVDFSATLINNEVVLNWITASELNNDFFTVERSSGGEVFTSMGQVNGRGTTNQAHSYNLIDTHPLNGRSYYRLKQTDFDGSFSYSKIVSVVYEGSSTAALMVYPNPSNGTELTIELEGLGDTNSVPVVMYDQLGKEYSRFELRSDLNGGYIKETWVFTDPIPKGVYILKAGPTPSLTKRLIVVN